MPSGRSPPFARSFASLGPCAAHFRSSPISGRCPLRSACPKSAKVGSQSACAHSSPACHFLTIGSVLPVLPLYIIDFQVIGNGSAGLAPLGSYRRRLRPSGTHRPHRTHSSAGRPGLRNRERRTPPAVGSGPPFGNRPDRQTGLDDQCVRRLLVRRQAVNRHQKMTPSPRGISIA